MSKSARKLKFEEAMQRLDAIVEAMESGEIGIEDSITRYEEAMELAAHCRRILEEAELRIKRIQQDAAGQIRAEAFEPPPTSPEEAEGDEEDET
jgi:exodeoxyribonuclease VII small subunit